MAVTLLEKRLLDYENKQTKNLGLDEIFVSFYLETLHGVEIRTKKLSELFVKTGKGDNVKIRPLKNYDEFVKFHKDNKVYIEDSGNEPLPQKGSMVLNAGGDPILDRNGNAYVNETSPYYSAFEIDKTFTTEEDVNITKTTGGRSSVVNSGVPYGLSKTVGVHELDTTTNDNFLMVQFDDSSKHEFVRKSDLYYKEGANIVRVYENGRPIDLNRIKDKILYVGNQMVDSIYTEKEFNFDVLQEFEKVDAQTHTKYTYQLIENPSEEQKNQVGTGAVELVNGAYYLQADKKVAEQYYSQAGQETITVQDPKKPGKTKQESYYAVKTYCINGNGDYVNLKIKGDNKVSMINISELTDENGNVIDKTNILNYVGKSIMVKTQDNLVLSTEALTYEQAVYFYEKQYRYEPSLKATDILTDDAYLQTKTGEFVHENLVKPISYKFTDDDNCDAYLIKVSTAEGVKEKVVSRSDYKKATKGVEVEAVYKLQTTPYEDGQVIQTTNDNKIKDCVVLGTYNNEEDVYQELQAEDKQQLQTQLLQNFNETYKSGQYTVDYVYDEQGNKVELDARHKRFVYSDTHYMKDYANDLIFSYAGLKNSTITYDSKKGKFNGNAKLGFGKTCKKAFGVWGKSIVYYIGISMSPVGLLATLAAPAVAVVAAGALVAAPVLIPAITGVTCFVKNVLNRQFKDKTKYNRKKWNSDIKKELNAINENMKETKITKGLSENALIARINRLKADILAEAECQVGNGFKMVDGKIVVTGENVNQVKKFKKLHKSELAKLKARGKKLERAENKYKKAYAPFKEKEEAGLIIDPENKKYKKYLELKKSYTDIKSIYDKEEEKFNNNILNHTDPALKYSKNSKFDKNIKKADRLKNFWLIKRFTSEERLEELGFTAEEIEKINKIDYNTNSDMFVTKQGKFKVDNCDEVETENDENLSEKAKQKLEMQKLLAKFKKVIDSEILTNNNVSAEEIYTANPAETNDLETEESLNPEHELGRETPQLDGDEHNNEEGAVAPEEVVAPVEAAAPVRRVKLYNEKIVSEDALVKVLKARKESKLRQKLISYVSEQVGEEISEADIEKVIKRINDKHNPKVGDSKSAMAGALQLKNKNIYNVLAYGQQYLTEYAQDIKKKTTKNTEINL